MTNDTDKFVESMRALHPAEVDKFLHDMENDICYPLLTEEQAVAYVKHMKNKDGSTGEHWTLEQTKAYQASHPDYASIGPLDFYVAMNMMYSDYFKATTSTDSYAVMAKDFVVDVDGPSNKVVRYIAAMN